MKPLSRSSTPLSFEIIHTSLLSKPRYVALSYTWGPPGGVCRILVNGQHFPIRQNLDDALRQVQGSKLGNQCIWVDAICINQGEDTDALSERNVQITLMTQIYEQANQILVWLGRPVNEARNRLGYSMMKDFENRFRWVMEKARPYRPWWWPTKPRTSGEDVADFLLTLSPTKDRNVFDAPGSRTYNAWLGIIDLWKSPWWTRTWVFQESTIPERYTTMFVRGVTVLPSSGKVRFLCGDQETGWSGIATTSVVASNILTTPGIDSRFLVGAQKSLDRLMKFRSQRVLQVLRSFLELLQMFRFTECLDPRDKVYAPLCLASDDVRRHIKPDYASKTVFDVYTDVVQYYLAQPGHELEFLGYALNRDEEQAVETPQGIMSVLPSWVPNFSTRLDIVPIPKVLHVPEKLNRGLTFYDKRGIPSKKGALTVAYSPLGDAPSGSFIMDNTLCASGVYIDVIKDMIPDTGQDLEAIRAVGREKGRKWAIDSKHIYFTGESYADAVNKTLVLDLIIDEHGRPSERGGKLDTAILRRPRAELSLAEYQCQMNMRSAQAIASTLRVLGLSQKLYLLMVPSIAAVGDMIWALAGGRALYILKPINRQLNQYRFIGECYVHGLMDGEIVRQLQSRQIRMEDLSLI